MKHKKTHLADENKTQHARNIVNAVIAEINVLEIIHPTEPFCIEWRKIVIMEIDTRNVRTRGMEGQIIAPEMVPREVDHKARDASA